jgi:ADP-heptose:LPS heptosyltransferase
MIPMSIYAPLTRLFPVRPAPAPKSVRRIVLILPCCIGDVVLATAVLCALRAAYPNAHITWAVGGWSKRAVEHHPHLDAVLDTGPAALPVRSPGGLVRFVRQLRKGRCDLAVSLVRSPLMSLAVWLARIPHRAGLDSDGRGFGYTIRAAIDPQTVRHEAAIYLDVAKALGIETTGCYANIPVTEPDADSIRAKLRDAGIDGPYIALNPAGGRNPGMMLDIKRWPPDRFAELGNRLAESLAARVVLVAGPDDGPLLAAVAGGRDEAPVVFAGTLSFGEIAALAREARVYAGNDTGLTHLAAAAGARTAMILGPTDPARYAPFTPDSIAVWKPAPVPSRGVAAGAAADWNWERDGVSVNAAFERIMAFVQG